VAKAAPNVIVVEPYYEGGLVQDIVRTLRATAVRIEAIGVPRQVLKRYGPPERHDEAYGLTAEGIQARIKNFLEIGNDT
jgi:deoxyxylulose-5-phosphate synthase